MRRLSLKGFVILSSIFIGITNFIHPVTPTKFLEQGLPDYMFGVAFAAMSLTNFLFSPFWGRFSDRYGRVRTFCLTGLIYAVGQLCFGLSNSVFTVVLARLLCGFAAGGYFVSSLAYVGDATTPENRSGYMLALASGNSVASAMGYLVGGIVGNRSIPLDFVVQIVSLVVFALLILFTVKEPIPRENTGSFAQVLKGSNPFSSLWEARTAINAVMATFLIGVFLCNFGTYSYDNAFNYFIKSELGFPPAYNGIIKAVMGLLGLASNLTLTVWIIHKTKVRRSFTLVLAACSLTLGLVVISSYLNVPAFIAANIVFYAFNATYIPIQQSLMLSTGSRASNGTVSGLFNASKSLGMVAGSLFAGFIYSFGSRLPFISSAIAFFLAMAVSVINSRQYRRICQPETETVEGVAR